MGRCLVSIRELKSGCKHYLHLARKGESVVITAHGEPVGRLLPISPEATGQDLAARLAAACGTGLAQWSGHNLRRRKPVASLLRGETVARLLVEDRE